MIICNNQKDTKVWALIYALLSFQLIVIYLVAQFTSQPPERFFKEIILGLEFSGIKWFSVHLFASVGDLSSDPYWECS